MNIQEILEKYDSMFGKATMEEIEQFLIEKIEEAKEKNDVSVLFTLLNEMIGFCRDTTQKTKGLQYCDMLIDLLSKMQLEGRVELATAFLNIANAYRAFGLYDDSLKLYTAVEANYRVNLPENAFQYASLYNNWSLLYQEMNDFYMAKEMLLRALKIVDSYENAKIEQATTRTNLASSLLQINTSDARNDAKKYLQEAIAIFEEDGCRNFHYGAAVVAMGDLYFQDKDFEKAAKYYKLGMAEIEKHVGKTDNYYRVKEKYDYVLEKTDKSFKLEKNIDRCRDFYEKYAKEMISNEFGEYENRIAVGLVGEGSDCFGFDDEISTDHDYGIGLCMWLTEEDFNVIGEGLQKAYEKLMSNHSDNSMNDVFFSQRRGVFSINDFYYNILQSNQDYEKQWELNYTDISEQALATAVNGEVYRDDLGIFSNVRKSLMNYYPEKVWRMRLAQSLHEFSQFAQSNYPRMMARKDYITANMCIAKAIESAMDIAYLLNRTYAPYYKWKKKGLEKLETLSEISVWLERIAICPLQNEAWDTINYNSSEINIKDKCVEYFENVAGIILGEMKKQDIVSGNDTFLEKYCSEVLYSKMDVVEEIVRLEWEQFDKVKNEGGRADCQDDWNTFSIMRKSQYLTWNRELLNSYHKDLINSNIKGWNMIMEKYARMMKNTAPARYAELEKQLPELSEDRIKIQETIVDIQVKWMEDFAVKYPKMAGNARSIHSTEDNAYNTSYETYLRGEIGTYSEETFMLYGRFIAKLMQEDRNLAYEIMNNTAKLYGYESVEDAERKL